MLRDNISREYALSKINAQMKSKEKEKRSSYVIDNNHSIEVTKVNVKNVVQALRNMGNSWFSKTNIAISFICAVFCLYKLIV